MANDKEFTKLRLTGLRSKVDALAARRGIHRSEWIRTAIMRQIEVELAIDPSCNIYLRPGVTLYQVLPGPAFSPLAAAVGGERVWIIRRLPDLPAALGSGTAWVCDVTSSDGGAEGRGVMVRLVDTTATVS